MPGKHELKGLPGAEVFRMERQDVLFDCGRLDLTPG